LIGARTVPDILKGEKMSKIGIIGGSGLYDIEELEDKKWIKVKTPFGKPSDDFLLSKLEGKEIVFLSRHSRGHRLSPSVINYRANIYGMKFLGVERIISVTTCGSLKKEYKPLDFVIPDQYVDRTNQARKYTFFDEGIVAHINFAHPVCADLAGLINAAVRKTGVTVHLGGTYINMEGPQFSTKAESNLYRSWGMDIIGMTNMAEARLAREAEICYATLAAVTDYDCWYEAEGSVSVEMILNNLMKNVANSKKILKETISSMSSQRNCLCKEALKHSIITNPQLIPRSVKKKLNIIIGKYIK
jgi:5'-methylthioadenosine phosphorylase